MMQREEKDIAFDYMYSVLRSHQRDTFIVIYDGGIRRQTSSSSSASASASAV